MKRHGTSIIGYVCIVALAVLGITACEDETSLGAEPSITSDESPSSDTSPTPEQSASPVESEDVAITDPSSGDEANTEPTGTDAEADALPDGLPEDVPDVGVPFYQPAELVATPSAGNPWVLEFVTDHELTIVNNTIANEFSEMNGWDDVNREVTGQQTVLTGRSNEYVLVIAIAPEPSDDFKTSLYYTLSIE